MAFKVAARTLLHLGSELISSDGVALYELIKNAFDAGSKKGVRIEVVMRLPDLSGQLRQRIEDAWEQEQTPEMSPSPTSIVTHFELLREEVAAAVDENAPGGSVFADQVRRTSTSSTLRTLIRQANNITIADRGHGMSLAELNDVYLTIGTRFRLKERERQPRDGQDPILGEKGLGRLAVMRLGQMVSVRTTRAGETHWNLLRIDWSLFSHDSDALIESIRVAPEEGISKEDSAVQGTSIEVSDLNAHWDRAKLNKIATEEISKLFDPFSDKRRYPVIITFNGGEPITVPSLDKEVFEHAQAFVEATYTVAGIWENPQVQLTGHIVSHQHHREKAFSLGLAELTDISQQPPQVLWSLGSFHMEAHWFNRQLLRKPGEEKRRFAEYVNHWSGGLMVFRDGFRVYPYGGPDDDWLNLDKKALASGGYKLNRRQFLGRVQISSRDNPALNDQSNREGLRNTPEKEALISMLYYVLNVQLRLLLNNAEKEIKAKLQVSFDTLGERVEREGKTARANLRLLRLHQPNLPELDLALIGAVESSLTELERTMEDAQQLADEFEAGREQLTHLAGLGLMVEMLAHELNRATAHALSTLGDAKRTSTSPLQRSLENLEFQLQTLQKRLRTLDPASTSGRQRKERFDLVKVIEGILEGHKAQFQRHGIDDAILVEPKGAAMPVHMVKGMIIQIVENLLANSIYWLKHQKLLQPGFRPKVRISVDTRRNELRVWDNGPGVAIDMAEDVFQAFFSTKPPREGKGLGLYISREIARYHKATLTISAEPKVHDGRLNTFVLSLPPS